LALGTYGFVVSAPLGHVLQQLMMKVTGDSPILRLLFANFVIIPINVSVFIAFRRWMEGVKKGKNSSEIISEIVYILKNRLFSILKSLWKVYIPAIFLIQKFVPSELWVLVFQVLGFVMGVLTNLAARKGN